MIGGSKTPQGALGLRSKGYGPAGSPPISKKPFHGDAGLGSSSAEKWFPRVQGPRTFLQERTDR
eukprot:641182-Prorocentrum_minimum.AAC.1